VRTEAVKLRHLADSHAATVALRELRGRDELALEGVDTRAAVALLARLLDECAYDALALAASDRDALLAAVHRQCWGDRIVSTLTCSACATRFDLSFELSVVQRHLAANDGVWRSDGARVVDDEGRAFEVPIARDELDAAELAPRAAVALLATRAGAGGDDERAAAALEAAAPIVDLDLAARCVDCGHEQLAHFDLQSFVLQRLLNERAALLSEIHLLACAYSWSLREILGLARSTRRALVATIVQSRGRAAPLQRATPR